MIEGYMTVNEAAKKWGINRRTVQIMCADGRIDGVTKFGSVWAIPKDAKRPNDKRIVSGKYVNWRKKVNKDLGDV